MAYVMERVARNRTAKEGVSRDRQTDTHTDRQTERERERERERVNEMSSLRTRPSRIREGERAHTRTLSVLSSKRREETNKQTNKHRSTYGHQRQKEKEHSAGKNRDFQHLGAATAAQTGGN